MSRSERPARSPGKRRLALLARLLSWLLALGILVALAHRVSWSALRVSLSQGPFTRLSAYLLALVAITLFADAWATHVSLAQVGARRPFLTLLLVRGSTYLLGLLSFALAQGGVGYYLHRTGLRVARVAGVVAFLLLIHLGVLTLGAGVALAAVGGGIGDRALVVAVAVLLAGGVVYTLLVAHPLRAFRQRESLAPLLEAGLSGHLLAALGRLPHVLLLVVGQWGAMRIWGIDLPFAFSFAVVPIILVVAALPVVPGGLGTMQATQVLLLAPYASGASLDERQATVLAFGLAFQGLGAAAQLLVGTVSFLALRWRWRDAGDVRGGGTT